MSGTTDGEAALGSSRSRGFRPGFLLLALLWRLAIFWSSSQSDPGGPKSTVFVFFANGVHAAIYAVLAFLLAMGVPRSRAWIVLALLATAALGAVDEWHQSFVPTRTASYFDWCTDVCGAAFGVMARLLLVARKGDRMRLVTGLALCVALASGSALAATLL